MCIRDRLFSDLNFAISKGQKLGLVGNNGCGKSTLLQIIAGQLTPSSGVIVRPDDLYYIPQHFGQYDSLTIAQALQIDHKQKALHAILAGDASIENFSILNDDWNIEERSVAALDSWGLGQFPLSLSLIHILPRIRYRSGRKVIAGHAGILSSVRYPQARVYGLEPSRTG